MATYQLPFSGDQIKNEIQQLVNNEFDNIMKALSPNASSDTNDMATTQWVKGVVGGLVAPAWITTSTLPTPSATTLNKIYIVPNSTIEAQSDFWITTYLNGVYNWYKIGTTYLSLDNYYTKDETDAKIVEVVDNYYTKTETEAKIVESLEDYYTKTETEAKIVEAIGNAIERSYPHE